MTLSPKDAERALLARYGAPAKPETDKVTGFKTGAGRVLAIDTRGKETRIWFQPPAPPPMGGITVLPAPNNGNHHLNGPLAPLRHSDTQRVEVDSPSALQRFLDWHDGSFAISYTSARFPSSYGVGSGTLSFSWDDLLWAAITIGRPNTAYVFRHGAASIHEALFRLSLMRMAFEQIPSSNRLHRTDAFRALDPTEKGGSHLLPRDGGL